MRTRSVQVKFFLSPKEVDFLELKMKEAGIRNRSAYLRKMALDGYIIRQDFEVLKGVANELGRIGNNLNQMAKIANTYGDISHSELKLMGEDLSRIWQLLVSLEEKPFKGEERLNKHPKRA